MKAKNKIVSLRALQARLAKDRQQGRKVVFTNGCFDILHAGHVSVLEFSRSKGDVLVVGLNSDESVRRLKGPTRPVNKQADRALVLAALESVSYVCIFKEDTPLSALFRKNSHEQLQTVMETWRPFLIGETEDMMKLNEFKFDLSRIQPSTIYLDLAQLINQGGLQCSMSVLAAYMFTHSNLSRSENALYVQLKRYKKLSE